MRHNVELKARLASLDPARQRARQVATSRLADQHQVDTYFHCANGRLKLREIRGGDSEHVAAQLIWYQRPDQADAKSSHYRLLPVDQPTQLKETLTAALGVWITVDKHRVIYLAETVRIHLDRVAGLGEFLEFEAVLEPGEAAHEGHHRVARLREHFGITDDALVSGSYSDLLAAKLNNRP